MSRAIETASERVFVVSPRPTRQGICETCSHAAYCMFARDGAQPVWHCEEFESPGPAGDNGRSAVLAAAEEDVENEEDGFDGLCGFCADRANCVCRTPGTAVQHCEEYC